ncbi:alpha/beta hydrolase [Lutibacter sp. B1]|uniref:alpha/beta hydrolase n=1 Tax=Lutibacter sp. B1 TaxID=2725996 RepID=UPI0014575A70|nr:alpha/beta hydrolase [Lutibacter sp. B1]NLP58234.1 alpha/beta hydrolase [Lutibacter sp. B1]
MKRYLSVLFFILPLFSLFAQEKNYNEQEVSIPTKTVKITGTLLSPKGIEKPSLVILIPGSGPTDRDGNNSMMRNNSLKFLAENLADNNIASYRFDKSVLSIDKNDTIAVKKVTFSSFINEAKEVVSYFKNSNNYSNLIVAGHSQGSLVGMVASQNNVDGYISLAGAGRTIDEVLVEQIEKQAPFLKEESVRIVTELKKGNTVEDFNPMLISLFKKQVQPFLSEWMQYNPQNEIKKLTIPVLIINGSKDIQVNTTEAELLHQSNQNSKLYIIENMNHLFKEVKGDINENIQTYNNPNLPVMVELINIISTFVNEIK